MAYTYLLDMHAYVDQRLMEAKDTLRNNGNDPLQKRFEEGRIEILTDYKAFLTEHFNPKLPRRIRETLFGIIN
jgi:hypothetical protein